MNNSESGGNQAPKSKLLNLLNNLSDDILCEEAYQQLVKSRQQIDNRILGDNYIPSEKAGQSETIRSDNKACVIGPDTVEDKTFDNFETKTRLHTEILTALKRWNWHKKGMYIYGNYGAGKTHLMHAFRTSLFERGVLKGKKLRLYNSVGLLASLKDFEPINKDYGGESSHDFHMRIVKTVDLLILDDFGANRATDYEIDTLFNILDHRCSHKLSTFCTSNLSANQVKAKFGMRLVERILELMVITECHTNESHRWKIQRESRD